MRRMLFHVVLALATVGVPAVAQAGTADDPELTDPCGIAEEVGSDLTPEASPDWSDVCAGWLETLSGPDEAPAIRVSIAMAGDITARPHPTAYDASWRVGDCLYLVQQRDEGHPSGAAAQFGFRCGPSSREVPCDPLQPLDGCTEYIPPVYTDLPEGVFSESGNVITATLVFAEGLAEHAAAHSAGSTLTRLHASATTVAPGASYCVSSDCGATGGDSASGGRDYVVEETGELTDGPLVPVKPTCTSGSVDSASADNPHVRDYDHTSAVVTIDNPDASSPGFDIRALWFTRAADGLDVHILPAGAADVPNTLYWVEFNGHFARAEGQPDGTWSAIAGPKGQNAYGGTTFAGTATTATMDAATGQVTIHVPEALLPAETALTIDRYFSHYIVGGDAPRPSPVGTTSHSVDSVSGGALICEAYR